MNPFNWNLPWIWLFVVLYILVFFRSCVVYSIARGMVSGAKRGNQRIRAALNSPSFRKAERVIGQYGPVAVMLCFLTIGFQTAVLASAGATRMPIRRYCAGLAVGAIFWAAIYSTIGIAGLKLLGLAWRTNPGLTILGLAGLAITVVIACTLVSRPQPQDKNVPDVETTVSPSTHVAA